MVQDSSTSSASSKTPARTDPRLERKRRLDREAQRLARNRNKAYIAHLEALVEKLSKETKNELLVGLTKQLNDVLEENKRLNNQLAAIHRIIDDQAPRPEKDGYLKSEKNMVDLRAQRPEEGDGLNTENNMDEAQAHTPRPDPSGEEGPLPPVTSRAITEGDQMVSLHQTSVFPEPSQPPPTTSMAVVAPGSPQSIRSDERHANIHNVESSQTPAADQGDRSTSDSAKYLQKSASCLEGVLFRFVRVTLSKAHWMTEESLMSTWAEDEDILIRAIFSGWGSTRPRHRLDEGWEILRRIDETIFASCGNIERLALLHAMRLKLRVSCLLCSFRWVKHPTADTLICLKASYTGQP